MALAAAPAVAAFFGGDAAAAARAHRADGADLRGALGALHDHRARLRRHAGRHRRAAGRRARASRRRSPPACCTRSSGAGQIGAGVAHQPVEPFRAALAALAEALDELSALDRPGRRARCAPARPRRGRARAAPAAATCASATTGVLRRAAARAARAAVAARGGPRRARSRGAPARRRARARLRRRRRCASTLGRATRSPLDAAHAVPAGARRWRPRSPRRRAAPRRRARGRRSTRCGAATSPTPSPRWRAAARASRPAGDDVLAGYAGWRHADGEPVSLRGAALLAARARVPPLRRAGRAARGRRARARRGPRRRRARSPHARAGARAVGRELRALRCSGAWPRRAERCVNEIGPNFIARPYRGVSVQDVADARRRRAARARARRGGSTGAPSSSSRVRGDERALVQVEREDGRRDPRRRCATRGCSRAPDEVAFVVDAVGRHRQREQLARAARRRADARVYVVAGPLPARELHRRAGAAARSACVEVVPPHPPKLLEMAQAVLDYDEDLPPRRARLRGDRPARARRRAPGRALPVPVPLRRARARRARSTSSTPARRDAADWTLVGCERSRQIHEALYGRDPHERVDFCPLLRRRRAGGADAAQVLPARARDRARRARG